MNLTDVNQAIEDAIKASWSYTPIAWENVPAKDYEAAGQPLLADGTDPFIEVAIEHVGSFPVEVPISCTRYHGYVIIDIQVREDAGTRSTADYMDKLSTLLEFKTISNVRLLEFISVGSYKVKKGWVTTTVQFPFEFERQV